MKHILKNKNLELHFDFPQENYQFSRFDWTGKITSVIYKNIPVTTSEKLKTQNDVVDGKGLYNEFGIETAVGFKEIKNGEWFHKIGVGILKKDDEPYFFNKKYEFQTTDFEVEVSTDSIHIYCKSKNINGYSYQLHKEIVLLDSGFKINYQLKNTGTKSINTDEYCHNFIAINNEQIGSAYILQFPFLLDSELFDAIVNPNENIVFTQQEFSFKSSNQEEFFFSNLSGGKKVTASWELINYKTKLGIRETGNFKTSKINLWGSNHVISPELFFNILLNSGETETWSRTYELFEI